MCVRVSPRLWKPWVHFPAVPPESGTGCPLCSQVPLLMAGMTTLPLDGEACECRGPGVGPSPAGLVSALRVRLGIPRAASASLSLTGPQRPDCSPRPQQLCPRPLTPREGPQRLEPVPRRPVLGLPAGPVVRPGAPSLRLLPRLPLSAPVPSAPCRPPCGPEGCVLSPSTPPPLGASDRGCRPCAGRAASPHQAGGQELVRTPRNPPPLAKAAPGRQSNAGSVLLLIPPWAEP